jgi:hypothetical protein
VRWYTSVFPALGRLRQMNQNSFDSSTRSPTCKEKAHQYIFILNLSIKKKTYQGQYIGQIHRAHKTLVRKRKTPVGGVVQWKEELLPLLGWKDQWYVGKVT